VSTDGPGTGDGTATAATRIAASAVDPVEVAVVLESEGVNDRVAAERYGARDVFVLAHAAFASVDTAVGREPPRAPAAGAETGSGAAPGRWFFLRGLLYAAPAIVALTLLPPGDPVESALVLGGLVASWAWGCGMTSIAWAYIGNLDAPAAHRFLRRSVLLGLVVSAAVAIVAIYLSLALTVTMRVSLWTLLLLVGQTAYLLAAATLLMTGNELRLLLALTPAIAGSVLAVTAGASGHLWLAATVVLAVVLALASTGDAAGPAQPLGRPAFAAALVHAGYGLMVALLVLYPAFNELLNENFESLPLSVTLAALPLVLAMGVAESLLYRHRVDVRHMLASTGSPADFARDVRRAVWRAQVQFIGALAAMTGLLGGLAVAVFGLVDMRFVLLGLDYVVLGAAIFAAMVLNLIGQVAVVLTILGGGVGVLVAFTLQADHLVDDATALMWHGAVGLAIFAVLAALIRRHTARTVSHR
jgi:hypothetical protein